MSRASVRDFFDAAAYVRGFVAKLQNLQSADDLKNLIEELRQLNDSQWRSELMDPENPSCSVSLLHSVLLAIINCSPSVKIRLSLLVELIAVSPVKLWEIKPLIPQQPLEKILEMLKFTPREALLKYLRELSNLLVHTPFEEWEKDIAEYLNFAKKLFLNAGENSPIELSSFVDVLSRNSLVDPRVWFEATIQESESKMVSKASILSLVMNRLGRSIRILDENAREAHDAGKLQNFINTQNCVAQRRNTTHLIRVVYEIVKRSSADHWDPLIDPHTQSVQAPLNELLNLMLIAYGHELIMRITQYVLSKASRRAIDVISSEQKEAIAEHKEFSDITSILEGREIPAVDLMDTLYSFSETCSRTYLLFLILSSDEEYVFRFMQLTEAEIMEAQVGAFSHVANNRWDQKLVHRNNCPEKFVGLTLLQAIILVLMEKLSDPINLERALMQLVKCVPAEAWDQPTSEKKVSVGVKSPRHLIWKLCQRKEKGYFFLAVLFPILESLPSERWQAEIPEYLKFMLKLFLTQGADLELTVAAFFYLLVSHSPAKEKRWFEPFDLNADVKQKKKGNALVDVTSPVCMLIDTLSAILKKFPLLPALATSPDEPMDSDCVARTPGDGAAAAACSGAKIPSKIDTLEEEKIARTYVLLTDSLTIIAERSANADWVPGLTKDAKNDPNGPLNHLVQLLLDDPQNPYFCEIVETVLKKATQESVNYISQENREKILAMPQFAKSKKLLKASCAKKAVVSAQAKPAENPAPKKVASKPSAKLAKPHFFAASALSQVETVLKKATQESVNYISQENREKILAMPQFAKNQKLLDASRDKKPAPKKSAVKVAAKPAAKKAVVSMQAKPAENPAPKKVASKPSAKLAKPHFFAASALSQPEEQSKTDSDSDDEFYRRVFEKRPPRPPSPLNGKWFSDDELEDEQNDAGHCSPGK